MKASTKSLAVLLCILIAGIAAATAAHADTERASAKGHRQCLIDEPLSVSTGKISYDRRVGDERHVVWSHPGNRAYWIVATVDGNFEITRYFTPYPDTMNDDGNVCLGNTCISRSQNKTAGAACKQQKPSLGIRPYPGFPADYMAAFECAATGFTPSNYTFDFGDGTSTTLPQYDIRHIYNQTGDYQITCTARHKQKLYTSSMNITITAPIPRQLLNRSLNFVNDSMTVNGYEDQGAFISILNQTNDTATLGCFAINHQHLEQQINQWTWWGLPDGVSSIANATEGTRGGTLTIRAGGNGPYTIGCGHAVTEPRYSPDFWDRSSVQYHHALFGCRYERPYACTGWGMFLNVTFPSSPG